MSQKIKYRVAHVGINTESAEEAKALTELLCGLFCQEPIGEGPNNIFAGDIIEVMKHSRRGKHGHVALQTEDVEAAMADLAEKGITLNVISVTDYVTPNTMVLPFIIATLY